MCTVTYIPDIKSKHFALTSNRDERFVRETLPPEVYERNGIKTCYPRDVLSGGSWIGMNQFGRIVCLLNGAFIAHTKLSKHTHSRGLVLNNVLNSRENARDYLTHYDLSRTEPFTLLTIDYNNGEINSFSEFIWDGSDKHYRDLDTEQAQIWSSVTLYNSEDRKKRRIWFSDFLRRKPIKSEADVLHFHSTSHTPDKNIDLLMKREDLLQTVSITQVVANGKLNMYYKDLLENKNHYSVL